MHYNTINCLPLYTVLHTPHSLHPVPHTLPVHCLPPIHYHSYIGFHRMLSIYAALSSIRCTPYTLLPSIHFPLYIFPPYTTLHNYTALHNFQLTNYLRLFAPDTKEISEPCSPDYTYIIRKDYWFTGVRENGIVHCCSGLQRRSTLQSIKHVVGRWAFHCRWSDRLAYLSDHQKFVNINDSSSICSCAENGMHMQPLQPQYYWAVDHCIPAHAIPTGHIQCNAGRGYPLCHGPPAGNGPLVPEKSAPSLQINLIGPAMFFLWAAWTDPSLRDAELVLWSLAGNCGT